jgi:TatA/E family protein of Tat protein translocase
MFGLGTLEIVCVAGVAVVLFGSRLPALARSVGQSVVEFKRGFLEVEKECRELDREVS